jgi:hypothetical protein
MTTHENFQHSASDDTGYFENGRQQLWKRLSSELDISNSFGRRVLHAQRRNRRVVAGACLFICIGAAFLLPMNKSGHKRTAIQFAISPSRKVLTPAPDSLAVTPVTQVKNDPVKTIIIHEVKRPLRPQELATADSSAMNRFQEPGAVPKQLQPAVYADPTSAPQLKNAQNSIDENDIWDVIQTQADRNYEQQKKNKKDSGYNKKRIDISPTQINH